MFLSPNQLLERVSIPSGSRVGDFGTGAGQFALEVAKRLGSEATIYAFDPFAPSLERLRRNARDTGAVFFTLESDLNQSIPLRDNLLTLAIVANTLFALHDRQKFVSELSRVVEPGGKVLVVDWMGSFNNMGPVPEAILAPSEAAQLFRDAGFETDEAMPAGTHHYAFTATCTVQ